MDFALVHHRLSHSHNVACLDEVAAHVDADVQHHFLYSLGNDSAKALFSGYELLDGRLSSTSPASGRFTSPAHSRSLTIETASITEQEGERMSFETTPGSPPDLSSSKSSTKSSSLRSSSITTCDDLHQVSHFEDIALHDREIHPQSRPPMKQQPYMRSSNSLAPRPKKSESTSDLRMSNAVASEFSGPLQKSQGRGMPGERTYPNGARQWHSRSDFMSSSPSLSIPNTTSKRPGPAPPPRVDSLGPSSYPSPLNTSRPRLFGTHSGPPSRRQSWNRSRKSVQELEDEYHDSDEDLPEDVIVWNVPLSPRPLHTREASTSPDRNSAALPTRKANPSRTKSWTEAMLDLSEEAKVLTSALEIHADRRLSEGANAFNSSPPRPSLPKKRAKSVLLPPTQTCNLMIDPLPPSKEKEKFLSRTRPSWLPPKSPQEERRHLKEYQQMMSISMETEKRREMQQAKARQLKEAEKTTNSRLWEEHVLPNWDTAINEPRTRELWWAGITPRSRGKVWLRALGNELHLTEASYTAALTRAVTLDQKFAGMQAEDKRDIKELAWFSAIRSDASAAFPELKIFQAADGPLYQPLVDLLMAYAMYRSDVGHVHGAHLPAALLLLNLSPADAFIAFANLLNRPTSLATYLRDPSSLANTHRLILQALAYKLPLLHEYLTSPALELEPDEYLDPLLRTLFTRGLGVDCSSRIWDVYMFEGENALVRAVVGVFSRLEGKLYGTKAEILQILGWDGIAKDGSLIGVGTEEGFMASMRWAGKVEVRDDE